MRISDWSSDVCSSDLPGAGFSGRPDKLAMLPRRCARLAGDAGAALGAAATRRAARRNLPARGRALYGLLSLRGMERSEEHTSELQSLMRISYAVFCLKKKKNTDTNNKETD